ncbi:hypothetical protein [Bacillus paranthracis]|uniref:hypothetical protein n=1 Tax=Bacillus paranthracis TaxID=2026186 RepID=UPI003D64B73E
MKTTNKLEIMLDVLEKGDKNALLNFVRGMSQSEMSNMAKVVPAIRSSLQYEYPEPPTQTPKYNVKRTDDGIVVEIGNPSPRNYIKRRENAEQELEKEQEEISEKYGKRAATPKAEFIKISNHEELFDLIMEDKKEKGWSFKDE